MKTRSYCDVRKAHYDVEKSYCDFRKEIFDVAIRVSPTVLNFGLVLKSKSKERMCYLHRRYILIVGNPMGKVVNGNFWTLLMELDLIDESTVSDHFMSMYDTRLCLLSPCFHEVDY